MTLPPPKPANDGIRGVPLGPLVWMVVRCDGVMYGPFESRHDAVGAVAVRRGAKGDWFDVVRVPLGRVPIGGVRAYE